MVLKNPLLASHSPKSELYYITIYKALSDLAVDFLLCVFINSRLQSQWLFASFKCIKDILLLNVFHILNRTFVNVLCPP